MVTGTVMRCARCGGTALVSTVLVPAVNATPATVTWRCRDCGTVSTEPDEARRGQPPDSMPN
jgi:uncharacterized Zn finger protein